MHISEFDYDLPQDLIAQYPLPQRSASRLLVLGEAEGEYSEGKVADLGQWLKAGDLLVMNDTRVIPARLFGNKETGGQVEILLERLLGENEALVQIRASKSPKSGQRIRVGGAAELEVVNRAEMFYRIRLISKGSLAKLFEGQGHIPLPPYIQREDDAGDQERYQTVFAKTPGAVAAPTAGLHFDEALLESFTAQDVNLGWLTLHVGAGTFQPVRSENLEDHKMHKEIVNIPSQLVDNIEKTKDSGGRVIAIGTTVVRALESAVDEQGKLQAGTRESDLFITPGFRFQIVDALLTNFHLPKSTLLVMVSAFAGKARAMQAYAYAIKRKYRFYSYGDAMFVTRVSS